MLIPLPFGVLLAARQRRPRWLLAFMAISMSGLAVLGMSVLTSLVDGTPILPMGLREWREFIEYAASIGLSFVTGLIIGSMSGQKARVQRAAEACPWHSLAWSATARRRTNFRQWSRDSTIWAGTLTAAGTTLGCRPRSACRA
ncbi:MAG: hypothetical protein IPN75_03630 [Dechloromonas sp.]|uniref:Uncharacterized protein n=1 Tax=Candidatus Dechloromonas phosphorivorans TaxID=2899244 RepID=A0A9D7QJL0_9RHOO|nr:hypothetical protein [Candidatus Dechloromonas phosphorivorans]